MIELKRPDSRILTSPRKDTFVLSRSAATAIAQAELYSAQLTGSLHHEGSFVLGNRTDIFIVMGLSQDLADTHSLDVVRTEMARLLPGNCQIIPYDTLLERFDESARARIHFLRFEPHVQRGHNRTYSARCVRGHITRPDALACISCGSPLEPTSYEYVYDPVVAICSLGRIFDGQSTRMPEQFPVAIDTVMGRNPRKRRDDGPRTLVRVDDPDRDVSGVHLLLRVDGWNVFAEDMDSTNGSELVLPDGSREQLRPRTPRRVHLGSRVELAGVVEVRLGPPETALA